jgi:hypothetical protein
MKPIYFLLTVFFLCTTACGARIPSQAKTAKIATKFFNKYGDKNKQTLFYKNKVTSVDVQEIQEMQKDLATSFMIVTLTDETRVPVIMTLLRKPPGGWRTNGWEWVRE